MRKDLDRALVAVASHAQTISLLRFNGAMNQRIVEDTAQVLGRHFITLPPTVVSRSAQHLAEKWRMAMHGSPQFVDMSRAQALDLVGASLRQLELDTMLGDIRRDLQGLVHVRFQHGDKLVGYGISDMALESTPREVLVPRIAEFMAERMCQLLVEDES